MTWTRREVEDAIRRSSPKLLTQADNARTTQDADALERELGGVFYMREKAHTTRCAPALIAEWDHVDIRMKTAIARIRGEQKRANR